MSGDTWKIELSGALRPSSRGAAAGARPPRSPAVAVRRYLPPTSPPGISMTAACVDALARASSAATES